MSAGGEGASAPSGEPRDIEPELDVFDDHFEAYAGERPGYQFLSVCSRHRAPDRADDCEACKTGSYRRIEPALSVTWADLDAGLIAAAFHETYERLAPQFGYRTREDSAVAWSDVPQQNRQLMIATAKLLLERGVIRRGDRI